MSDREIKLLTDADVQRFILDGFLVLGLDELGAGFHENVYRAALERQPQSGLSDEIDAAMPELREVLASPTVRGALEGLLGRGDLRHPHSAAYVESGAPEAAGAVPYDQGWHRDSYWGVQRVRHHRPRWLLCMYYPAAVTLEMGPTAIAPGSQYYALPADGDGSARPPGQPIRHDRIDDPEGLMQGADLAARDRLLHATIGSLDPSIREVPMVVPAGSFCCFHYDIYHRRMRRHPAPDSPVPPRIVFKFLFTVGAARTAPSWAHGNGRTALPWDAAGPTPPSLAAAIWSFMTGDAQHFARSTQAPTELVAALHGGDREAQRMDAAYRIARAGRAGSDEAVRRLVAALRDGGDATQRAAMHGLTAVGAAAVGPLIELLTESDLDDHIACCALHALGEAAEKPSLAIVAVVAERMERAERTIVAEARGAGGWPRGGGGHPPSSGFDFWSPNPKEQQAWTPKLLHATCLQTLGVMGQNAAAAGNDEVLRAVVERCVASLKRPEPGGGNPDYPPDSILGSGLMSRQNAALALRMLGGHGTVAGALRQEVVAACSRALADPDRYLAHYCRDTLRALG